MIVIGYICLPHQSSEKFYPVVACFEPPVVLCSVEALSWACGCVQAHVQNLPMVARHGESSLLFLSHIHDRFIFLCMVTVTLAHVLSFSVALSSPSEAGLMQAVLCSLGYKTGQENLLCWSETALGFLHFVLLLNSSSNFLASSLRPHFAAPECASLIVRLCGISCHHWCITQCAGALGTLLCQFSVPHSSLGSCVTCKTSRRLANSVFCLLDSSMYLWESK